MKLEKINKQFHLDGVPINETILIAVRQPKGENKYNFYDDRIYVVTPAGYNVFKANTDPSKWGQKLAQLDEGEYSFYKGKHRNKYDALRAHPEGVKWPCHRDGVASTCQYINIHKGGVGHTSSEGCQTLHPDDWTNFINSVYAKMGLFSQKTIKYILTRDKVEVVE